MPSVETVLTGVAFLAALAFLAYIAWGYRDARDFERENPVRQWYERDHL